MENVQRVVIKRPASPEDIAECRKLIYLLKTDLDLTAEQHRRGLLTPEKLSQKEQIWNNTYDRVAHLCGFESVDDMRYFRNHFTNL